MSCWSFFILHNMFDPSWTSNISWRDSQPALWWFSRQGFTILIWPKSKNWLHLSQFIHRLKLFNIQTCQLTLILKLLLLMPILMRVTFTTFLLHISCCFGWKRFNTRYKRVPLSFPTTFDVEVSELFFLSAGWSYLTKLILERRQSKILFVSLIWNAHPSMNLLLHDFRMNLNIVMMTRA